MLWEALALEGFGKLLKSLRRLAEALASALYVSHRGSGRLWEVLGASGKFWERLGGFERLWYASEGFGRFWKALEGFGRHGKALGGFWMFWDALEGWQPGCDPMDALEGFGGVRSL